MRIVNVGYKFGGFQSPLPKQTFNQGSSVPVKFKLYDSKNAIVSTAKAKIYVDSLSKPGTPSNTSIYSGNNFRYDPTTSTYQYDLKTIGLVKGLHTLIVTLDDNTQQTVQINLK